MGKVSLVIILISFLLLLFQLVYISEKDRGHFFLRIMIHQSNDTVISGTDVYNDSNLSHIKEQLRGDIISHLHIVDLIGKI